MNQSIYQRTALGQQEILERNLKIPSRARTLLLLIESYDLDQLDRKIAHPDHFDILIDLGLITKLDLPIIHDHTHLEPSSSPDYSTLNTSNQNHSHTEDINHPQYSEQLGAITALKRLRVITDKISQNIKKSAIPQSAIQHKVHPPTHLTSDESVIPSETYQHQVPSLTEQDILQSQHASSITTSLNIHSNKQPTANINPIHAKNLEMDLPPLSFIEVQNIMQETLKQYCGLMAKQLVYAIAQSKTPHELRIHQKKWLTDLFETRISREQLTILKNHINFSLHIIEQTKRYTKNHDII